MKLALKIVVVCVVVALFAYLLFFSVLFAVIPQTSMCDETGLTVGWLIFLPLAVFTTEILEYWRQSK